MIMSWFVLMPIIFLSSLLLTMVGLGGGLIFSPLFVLLSFPVGSAVSASLFLNGFAALSALITYLRKGMVDIRIGVPLIISSTLAAPLGALTTSRINLSVFTTILAAVIVLAALRMLFSGPMSEQPGTVTPSVRIIGGTIIGLAIGFMAGLLGIGGGVFIVPLLIYILKVPTKTAAATSIFIVVFYSFSGFFTHISMHRPDWQFIGLAALFSIAGGQIGSRIMAERLKGITVRRLFGVVLLLFAAKLLQGVW